MNTKQLIVLWYTGLIVIVIIFAGFGDAVGGQGHSALLIASIIIIGGLLIFTFKKHPEANKKRVALWILMPIGGIITIIIIIMMYTFWRESPVFWEKISVNNIETTNSRLEFYKYNEAKFSGQIKNLDQKNLSWIKMRITIYDSLGNRLDRSNCEIWLNGRLGGVQYSQTRSFAASIWFKAKPPDNWKWARTTIDARSSP